MITMYYHYVFRTYKKYNILTDKDIVKDLSNYFYEISKEKGFHIDKLSILADHVHMLIKQKQSDNLSYIMKAIKGISARKLFKNYNSNRFVYRKLWGRSFFAEEIKPENINKIRYYIKGQKRSGIDKRAISRNREVHSQVPS